MAYGWTRGDFLSVMSARRRNRQQPSSPVSSYVAMEEEEEETEEEDDREDREKGREFLTENSLLLSSNTATDSMIGERGQRRCTSSQVSRRGYLGN